MEGMVVRVEPRIKGRRQEAGLSQEGLARRVECSAVTIGKLERGEDMPRLLMAMRIARALGCRVEDLWVLSEVESP